MSDERGATLGAPEVDKLISLIRDSFRVRENQNPIYVDTGGNFARVASAQHQIVFGRRGSGKSCLLVYFHRQAKKRREILPIYIDVDEVKRLGYPDLLIRLLISIFRGVAGQRRTFLGRLFARTPQLVENQVMGLETLLDEAASAKVIEEYRHHQSARAGASIGASGARVSAGLEDGSSAGRTQEFVEAKLDYLERHLADFKQGLRDALSKTGFGRAAILVDDFYLVSRDLQPDLIDYLHRLFRGTDLYLKVGTVRHRTSLKRHNGQTIGVELYQDVEAIDLDQTFENLEATKGYLATMLDSMGEKVGINSVTGTLFNPDALQELTLASGGVPRDYLTIFVEAVSAARQGGEERWLTPRWIYKGAARVSTRTKLANLREDVGGDANALERVFRDLVNFCIRDKRKTAFLISEDDASQNPVEHEMIQQLMDFKIIHVIEPDTSAASGRPGRYGAYTLDFALFMEPRRRNIEIVEFWKVDEAHRRVGVRESPVYELSRIKTVLVIPPTESTEELLDGLETEDDDSS